MKGTFLLGVEKDAKQKNLRRSFVKKENQKLISKLNEISTKEGRLSKHKLDPKMIIHGRMSMDEQRKKKTPLRPINNVTLKKQLWSNKNVRNYLDRNEVHGQNKDLLTRIKSARSVYSIKQWKEAEDKNNEYRKNIGSKYSTNDLTYGAGFCPLNAHRRAESASMKKFMYYKIDDEFERKYNGSYRGNPTNMSAGSKEGFMLKKNGRARSALNLLNLSEEQGKLERFKLSGPNTNSSTKILSGTNPASNNSLTGKGVAMREGVPHKRAFSLMKNQPRYEDGELKEGGLTEGHSKDDSKKEIVL